MTISQVVAIAFLILTVYIAGGGDDDALIAGWVVIFLAMLLCTIR